MPAPVQYMARVPLRNTGEMLAQEHCRRSLRVAAAALVLAGRRALGREDGHPAFEETGVERRFMGYPENAFSSTSGASFGGSHPEDEVSRARPVLRAHGIARSGWVFRAGDR